MNTHDHHCHQYESSYSRRDFLTKTSLGLGAAALGSLMTPSQLLAKTLSEGPEKGILGKPHFPPKAKRVIYLFMSGGPSQIDLLDHKPLLQERHGEELPDSVRGGQRLTGMSAGQKTFPLVGTPYEFNQYGQSGHWFSELLPYTSKVADDLCVVKSMFTEAINHDPAATFIQTGSQFPGRPSIGSWLSYGLGSENENLPAFCVLVTKDKTGQPLYARLWGNGFLPSRHQGVQFRAGSDPVLYLSNPPGMDGADRKRQLDYLRQLQEMQLERESDPEIASRIAQYEMAYRMQTSVPETMDVSGEPDYIYDMYGPDSRTPGTFAANCLLAPPLS